MKRLATTSNTVLANRVADELNEAGIRAAVTREDRAFVPIGLRQSIIWIADDADEQLAQAVFERIAAERTMGRCPVCKYDLTGHPGQSHCPECGSAVTGPVADWVCPNCGETVPGTFEVCWNCGEPGAKN